jgi:outer membrane protein TolC
VVDSGGVPVTAFNVPALSFDTPLNQYSLTAQLAVPISDYVLRISHNYASASHAESAKRIDLEAETLQVAADAKVGLFNWIRAKGQVVVAREALARDKAHAEDAKRIFQVGYASKADVLGLEAQVAQSEQLVVAAEAFEAVTDEQLRLVLQAPPGKELRIGVDVLHSGTSVPPETLAALQDEALKRRLEIRALDETIYSLKRVESIARAGYFPRVDGFASVTYANPNQRYFLSDDQWNASWQAGVSLTWTLNDTFTALSTVSEAKARMEAIEEQKATLLQGLRLEVANAHAELKKAAATIDAAERGLAAAEEALRVRRELFRNGKATSVDLIDAQTAVTRARLQRINAHVGLLVARTRLEHATGRDTPTTRAADASR